LLSKLVFIPFIERDESIDVDNSVVTNMCEGDKEESDHREVIVL
jgi:hypothetical protein